jgi:Isochorismatase family
LPRGFSFGAWLAVDGFGPGEGGRGHSFGHRGRPVGLIVHTCVEATVRFAVEFGYEVTVVRDATASYSDAEIHAALDINLPNYASAIVTADQVVDSLSSVQA